MQVEIMVVERHLYVGPMNEFQSSCMKNQNARPKYNENKKKFRL